MINAGNSNTAPFVFAFSGTLCVWMFGGCKASPSHESINVDGTIAHMPRRRYMGLIMPPSWQRLKFRVCMDLPLPLLWW